MKQLIFAFVFALLATAATKAASASTMHVLNEQLQPIAGATVLFGEALGNPFEGNELSTDLNGQVTLPTEWRGPLPVTIRAAGYLTTTYIGVALEDRSFQLNKGDVRNPIQISGNTTGYGTLRTDGKVDFGLVFPALSRRQLAQFDVNAMISPEYDTIDIIGEQVNLPSNLTLPEQTENYFLPINLNKPNYRAFVKQPGNYRVTAIHGQFPLKQVVGDIRNGKSFFDVINYFKFIGGGQKDVTVTNSVGDQHIPVNQITYNKSITVKAPVIPAGQVMVACSLVNQAGLMFPADIKKVESNAQQVLLVPGTSEKNNVVSVLTHKDNKSMGGPNEFENMFNPDEQPSDLPKVFNYFSLRQPTLDDLTDQANTQAEPNISSAISVALLNEGELTPTFLNLIDPPTATGTRTTLALHPPAEAPGVTAVATYLILSEVAVHDIGGGKTVERTFRVWEGFQPGWTAEFSAPPSAIEFQAGKKYRWEVLFLGQSTTSSGAYFLDEVTHITRNSLDIQ